MLGPRTPSVNCRATARDVSGQFTSIRSATFHLLGEDYFVPGRDRKASQFWSLLPTLATGPRKVEDDPGCVKTRFM